MKYFAKRSGLIVSLLLAPLAHASVDTCHILCDVEWLAQVDEVELRDVLDSKAESEIKGRDEYDWTPLHLAARWGKPEVIEVLVNAGASLEAITEFNGQTPLHSAVGSGKVENIEALILAGANIESRCIKGGTPLHWAAQFGSVRIVQKLIDEGAMLEARDRNGYTPLHWAAKKGMPAKLRVLIAAGADIKARTIHGMVPADFADGNPLIQGSDVYWILHDARFN
ncbi:ankyrin repeat domain-containing protein [Alphaproteobacteria bacterium LSUCC0684]